jgi:5-(carboxyamino)imidazole ribonucleotide synthase
MKIGIIGDGQLALMLGEAAAAQGLDFLGYGDDLHSSFAVRFPERFRSSQILSGARAQPNAARVSFAKECDVLTLENEFLSYDELLDLEAVSGTPIIPNPESYRYFQDKISQRKFYESLGIPGPQWQEVTAEMKPSFPLVLKASQGGYDGHGVKVVENEKDYFAALAQFGFEKGKKVLAEEKVKIVREFAQGVLLDGKGNAIFLPLMETLQRNGTCVLTFSKFTINDEQALLVRTQVRNALEKISKTRLIGLFNFEFFYTEAGDVWINEGAPRPHNSQHLTLDASPVSQFSILMNFLAKGELDPEWIGKEIPADPAVMVNLLGKSSGKDYTLDWPKLPDEVKSFPKLYLKKECRPGRKMGHLNLVDLSGKVNLSELGEKVLKEYRL